MILRRVINPGFELNGREHEYYLMVALTFLQGFFWFMVVPLIPLFAAELGAHEFLVGLITSVTSIIFIITSIPSGALSDMLGSRALFRWTYVLGVVGALLYVVTPTAALLFVPQLFYAFSNTLFWPAWAAHLVSLVPGPQQARMMGYASGVSGLGAILGPLVGGFLVDRAGFRAMFLLYAAFSVAGFFLASALPPHRNQGRPSSQSTRGGRVDPGDSWAAFRRLGPSLIDGVRLLRREPVLTAFWTTFFAFLSMNMADIFMPLYLKDTGVGIAAIGLIMTARNVTLTVSRFAMGPLVRRMGLRTLLVWFVLISAAAGMLVPLVGNMSGLALGLPAMLLLSSLMGLGPGVNPPINKALIAEGTGPSERATGMGLSEVAGSGGRFVSSLAFGAMAQGLGNGAAIIGGNLLAVVVYLVGARRAMGPPSRTIPRQEKVAAGREMPR